MKKEEIKIGDKAWIVKNDFTIEQKTIIEISDAMDKEDSKKQIKKYKLDVFACGGLERKQFHTKRSLAELHVKKLTTNLKYKIGDIVVVKRRTSYNRSRESLLGRIINYVNEQDSPYRVLTLGGLYNYNSSQNYPEEDLVKVKDDYIENFEDITDLQKEMYDMEQNYNSKHKELQNKYDKLTKDIKHKFEKSTSCFLHKKRRLEYKDIFVSNRDESY